MTNELTNVNVSDGQRIVGTSNNVSESIRSAQLHNAAVEAGYSNVNQYWIDTGTMTWDEFHSVLDEKERLNQDVSIKLGDLAFRGDGGKVRLGWGDEGYRLDGQSRQFVAGMLGLNPGLLDGGRTNRENELIVDLLNERLEGVKKEKEGIGVGSVKVGKRKRGEGIGSIGELERVFRLQLPDGNGEDGLIRAIVTDLYTGSGMSNRWIAGFVQGYTSGESRVSHFDKRRFLEGTGDVIRYNVLLKDTIMHPDNDGFGGMLSVANGQNATIRCGILPSLFRWVCLNGCVWSNNNGSNVSFIHKGRNSEIDLEVLAFKMGKMLDAQLPVLTQVEAYFRNLESMVCQNTTVPQILGYLASLNRFTKQERKLLYTVYTEQCQEEHYGQDAYSVVNALTRMAQQSKLSLEFTDNLEILGGSLVNQWNTQDGSWELINANAANYDIQKDLVALENVAI